MRPINQEQVVQTAQILLAVISDEEGSTPNKYLEGVVSGKSLLRAIIAGKLVVCATGAPDPKQEDPGLDSDDGQEDVTLPPSDDSDDAAPDAKD